MKPKSKRNTKSFPAGAVFLFLFGLHYVIRLDANFNLSFPEFLTKKKQNDRRLYKRYNTSAGSISPYDQEDILSLAWGAQGSHPMILVFDGTEFRSYLLGHIYMYFRYVPIIPLMIHALETNYPNRFQPGQPVFQMIFTVSDFLSSDCINKRHLCELNAFYPSFVSFSSVLRDTSIFPTAKAFPNPIFCACIENWLRGVRTCEWQEVDQTIPFEELKNILIWRGSDFGFLHTLYKHQEDNHQLHRVFSDYSLAKRSDEIILNELMERYIGLTPRWKAVLISLRDRLSNEKSNSNLWIDALFSGSFNEEVHQMLNRRGFIVSDKNPIDAMAMSAYKYQIDLGGGKYFVAYIFFL
jgi:hypothetical protein